MRLNSKAQTILEYTLLVMLVAAGIVIGGPMAFNAYRGAVKTQTTLLDERGPDVDALTKAPGGQVQVPGCVCGGWQDIGCRANDTCRNYRRNCTGSCPPVEIQCFPDNSCCTNLVPVINPPDGCGPPRCAVGQIYSWQMCGDEISRRYSCPSSAACVFQCGNSYPGGTNPPPGATVCPSDNINLPSWTIPWRLNLGHDPQSTPACSQPAGSDPRCETFCPVGTTRNTTATQCEGCPQAATRSVHRCRCKGDDDGLGAYSPLYTCTEGPYTNPSCSAGSPIQCGVPHRFINIPVTANCPSGTVIDSGYCGLLDTQWAGGCDPNINIVSSSPSGTTGWTCVSNLCSQGGCHGRCEACYPMYAEAVAFCVPPPDCPQPVLENVVMQIIQPNNTNPPCPSGFRQVVVLPQNRSNWVPVNRVCARVANYQPRPVGQPGCANSTRVIRDIFVTGDNIFTNASLTTFIGHRQGVWNRCPSPGWSGWSWDGNSAYQFCKKDIDNTYCLANINCPSNKRKTVIKELIAFHPGTSQTCAQHFNSSAWQDIAYDPFSRIRFCKQMVDICVQ